MSTTLSVGIRRTTRHIKAIRHAPWLALGIVAMVVAIAVIGPLIVNVDPIAQNLGKTLQGPSQAHLMGTDNLGRDELSRVINASRVTLIAVLVVAVASLVLGLTVGTLAAWAGGWVDGLLMRTADLFLSLPALILGLAILGLLGPGLSNLLLALVISWWPAYARLARARILVTKQMPYVEALTLAGAHPARIVVRHLIPAAFGPALVLMSTEVGSIALSIATLSFLGLGIQPPTPEWGQMLVEARPYLLTSPTLLLFPGLAISVFVLAFNLLGESMVSRLERPTSKA